MLWDMIILGCLAGMSALGLYLTANLGRASKPNEESEDDFLDRQI